MNYILMRILSFVCKLSGVMMVIFGLVAVLIGLVGGGLLAGLLGSSNAGAFGIAPAVVGVVVAVAFVFNGVILFGVGDVVDAVVDIHETTQSTQAQLHKLITELNTYAKEQRNPRWPATMEAMQEALQNIQFAAKRAASASEEVLAIAQRGRR